MSDHPAAGDVAERTLAARLAELERRVEAQARTIAKLVGDRGRSADPNTVLLGTTEVCERLGVGRTKLNDLVQEGEVPMFMLGGQRRITEAQLERAIRRLAER